MDVLDWGILTVQTMISIIVGFIWGLYERERQLRKAMQHTIIIELPANEKVGAALLQFLHKVEDEQELEKGESHA